MFKGGSYLEKSITYIYIYIYISLPNVINSVSQQTFVDFLSLCAAIL